MIIKELFELQELCEKISNKVLPVKLAYKFAKIARFAEEEINFYRNQHTLYLNKYGEKDENGKFVFNLSNNIKIISGLEEECKDKFLELETMEIELPDIRFSLEELESVQLTIKDMIILDPFIIE